MMGINPVREAEHQAQERSGMVRSFCHDFLCEHAVMVDPKTQGKAAKGETRTFCEWHRLHYRTR